MARSPNKKVEQAYQLYKKGMKLVEIASQLNVPAGTVRRWKSTYHWDNEQNERSEKKKNGANKAVADEVKQVIQNTDLTDKQQLFCIYYIRCFNATKAYQKAYGCDYASAVVAGPRLLRNVRVKEEILQLKQERLNREFLNESDIFQKYMDIAFADMGDYVTFGRKEIPQWKQIDGQDIPVIDPNTGNQKMLEFSYVDLKESKDVDTSIISEVSEGKNGIKIKRADQMKALQWLSDHMDLATDKQRAEIALLQSKADAGKDDREDKLSKLFDQIEDVLRDD